MNGRRGSALPMVLGCTTLAMIVAVIAWDRAATRKLQSGRQVLVAQAEQGALAGLAVALHRIRNPADSTDSLILRTAFHQETRVGFESIALEGGLFPRAIGIGWIPHRTDTIRREVEATWGSRMDPKLFGSALVLFPGSAPFPTGLEIKGSVRVPSTMLLQGRLPSEHADLPRYYPASLGLDTVRAGNLYLAALPSEKAIFGGGRIDPSHPAPETGEELVYTKGDLDLSAPETGPLWSPGKGRRLVVEGRVDIRGPVDLSGWTLLAKGPVVIDGKARLRNAYLWSQGPVRLDGSASFQGTLFARGHVVLAGESRILGPSAGIVLRGISPDDTGSVLRLTERSQAEGYFIVRGPSALIELSSSTRLRGVGLATNLAVDGVLEGCAIGFNAQGNGRIDRTRLPPDFALPAGLGKDPTLVMVRKVFR